MNVTDNCVDMLSHNEQWVGDQVNAFDQIIIIIIIIIMSKKWQNYPKSFKWNQEPQDRNQQNQ